MVQQINRRWKFPPISINSYRAHRSKQLSGTRLICGCRCVRMRPPLSLFAESENGIPIASSQVTIDPATTEVVRWEPYSSLSLGRRLRTWARTTHTGEAGRLPGQIIACIASLGGGLLVWTGLRLRGGVFARGDCVRELMNLFTRALNWRKRARSKK